MAAPRTLPPAEKLAGMADGALMRELADVTAELALLGERQAALWEHRVAIYREGRSRTPPVTQQQLAQVAGVSEVAVIQALRKADAKDAKAATTTG